MKKIIAVVLAAIVIGAITFGVIYEKNRDTYSAFGDQVACVIYDS